METEDIILVSVLGAFALSYLEKKIMPSLIKLNTYVTEMFHDWRFYFALTLFLTLFSVITFKILEKRRKRLEKERIESEKHWKEHREKEEAIKKSMEYQIPKKRNNSEHLEIIPERKNVPQVKEINVDFDRKFYRRRELNEDEVEYLLKNEYHAFEARSIASGRKEKFILKPRFNESLKHLFFVYDIARFLEKRGIVLNLYETKMPDIVFNLNKKEYAVEVETGTVMTNPKKFREKIEGLNQNYKNRWFFVVTNKNLVKKYRKYGRTVDPRYVLGFLKKLLKNEKFSPSKNTGG